MDKVVMESVLRIVLRRRNALGEASKSSRSLAGALLKAMPEHCSTSTSLVAPDCVVIQTLPHSPCNG